MKLVDSDMLKGKIVLDSEQDEISSCKLINCEIIACFPAFMTTCLIRQTEPKPLPHRNIDKTKPYAKVRNCFLENCVLPEALYEQNVVTPMNIFTKIEERKQ